MFTINGDTAAADLDANVYMHGTPVSIEDGSMFVITLTICSCAMVEGNIVVTSVAANSVDGSTVGMTNTADSTTEIFNGGCTRDAYPADINFADVFH